MHESELATGCDSSGRTAAAASKCSVGRSVVSVSTDGLCMNLNWRPLATDARVDGLRMQLVSVQCATMWLVCRLTAIVRESDSAAVVTRLDGLRLQLVSVPWAAVWLVCRLTTIVHES